MTKFSRLRESESRTGGALLWNLLIVIFLTSWFLAALYFAVASQAAPINAPSALLTELQKTIRDDGVPGITVLVFKNGQLQYRVDAGRIAHETQLPVASASKWVAAALVMTVIDDGRLSLDEPIGCRLPEFTGEAGRITLRQILSFTSGQGGLSGLVDVRQDPQMTMRESARQIAMIPLQDKPGTVFKYGSPAFQIAGALVEQATRQSWSRLFDERLVQPLGLSHTFWGSPLRPDIPSSKIHNPNLQGGLVTTAQDYGKFLTMVASHGIYSGRRILSARSVDLMERVQTGAAKTAFIPPGAKTGLQYGLGNWCEVWDAKEKCIVVSSPGALGTYPWIDRRNDIYGLFFMHRRLPLVEREVLAARNIIEQTESPGMR